MTARQDDLPAYKALILFVDAGLGLLASASCRQAASGRLASFYRHFAAARDIAAIKEGDISRQLDKFRRRISQGRYVNFTYFHDY